MIIFQFIKLVKKKLFTNILGSSFKKKKFEIHKHAFGFIGFGGPQLTPWLHDKKQFWQEIQ